MKKTLLCALFQHKSSFKTGLIYVPVKSLYVLLSKSWNCKKKKSPTAESKLKPEATPKVWMSNGLQTCRFLKIPINSCTFPQIPADLFHKDPHKFLHLPTDSRRSVWNIFWVFFSSNLNCKENLESAQPYSKRVTITMEKSSKKRVNNPTNNKRHINK